MTQGNVMPCQEKCLTFNRIEAHKLRVAVTPLLVVAHEGPVDEAAVTVLGQVSRVEDVQVVSYPARRADPYVSRLRVVLDETLKGLLVLSAHGQGVEAGVVLLGGL